MPNPPCPSCKWCGALAKWALWQFLRLSNRLPRNISGPSSQHARIWQLATVEILCNTCLDPSLHHPLEEGFGWFSCSFLPSRKEWTVWALCCSAMLQAWRQKSSATDIIAKKGLGLNFFKSTSIGSSRGDIRTAPQNNKCKEAKKLCYISSQYHLYIDLRQLPQKTKAKCCISSPHHSLHLTDNSPQKNKQKKKVGYICAQCRNLNKDAWDWNISKGLTIEEDSFRHFLYLGILMQQKWQW